MIEQLLPILQVPGQPPDLQGIFLFDPQTNTDLINNNATVTSSGAAVDSAYLIDGQPTVKLTAITNYLLITIPTPIDLDVGDWTVEYSRVASSFSALASKYDGEFTGLTTASKNLVMRWTDTGYGRLLQAIIGGAVTAATYWRIQPPKDNMVNILSRMAIVCKSGVITIFKDGVPQQVRNWDEAGNASKVVVQNNFPKEASLGKLSSIRLGYVGTNNPAAPSNLGRIRISDYARYTSAYTPAPF